ncbi:hypothetical protein Ancab_010051, partial [Ancistrocladus abbreviatus]
PLKPSWWNNTINGDLIPTFAAFLSTLTLIILTLLAAAWIRRRKHQPIPPGPLALPLVGYFPFLSPSLHSYFTSLAQSYGPILSLRLGQKLCIVISSPSLAKEFLKDHDVTFANRDIPAAARTGVYGGVSTLVEDAEENRSPAYDRRSRPGLFLPRRPEIRRTIGYLQFKAGSPVNLGEQLLLTNDVEPDGERRVGGGEGGPRGRVPAVGGGVHVDVGDAERV